MRELNVWFEKNNRDFPWRKDRTPYKVWISEVMLQQTRANVVVPYFERWMTLFPDVLTLAKAPLEEVIKAWEGLGYYSRARNLHKAANQMINEFDGQIPKTKKALLSITGLGPYTVNAILSFGFKKRVAAVDGNVTRVISRLFKVKENVSKAVVKRKIQEGADTILDSEEPWISSEALIELGATICTPKPRCAVCPLNLSCLGKEIAHSLPIKNPKAEIIYLNRAVLVIESEGKFLLRKGQKGKVMADLYEFPYFEMGQEIWSKKKINEEAQKNLGLKLKATEKLSTVSHSFTRYKAKLYPVRAKINGNPEKVDGFLWVDEEDLSKLPFSSGHRRILHL